jgi:hypothetical protein
MQKIAAIVTVLISLGASSARSEQLQSCEGHPYVMADGQNVICSATWEFNANCSNGPDMWSDWKVTGRVDEPDAFVRPWLDVPILVVGYELVKLPRGRFKWPWNLGFDHYGSWFMIGSTITPDAMAFLGPGEAHSKQMWPRNSGQLWPRAADAKPIKPIRDASGKITGAEGDLINLHGVCYGGAVRVLLTIYYTPQPSHDPGLLN